MATLPPRVVLVTRETDYERLLAVHATPGQARFFLETRGQALDEIAARHENFQATVHRVRGAVPAEWRVAKVLRPDLDRFLFAPEDIVVAIGQDGLVANLAKYLRGQPVLGVNPAPDLNEGVLVPLGWADVPPLLPAVAARRVEVEMRTMAEAKLDDGQTLRALNEIFVGHRSHQSARYVIAAAGKQERQSSSGVIVSTGTGATGWARSIMSSTGHAMRLSPVDRRLSFFVREPWPSVATGNSIAWGAVSTDKPLTITSQMDDGGAIFADGMEHDRLAFGWGRSVSVTVASETLNLVRGA